jgi:hypothetical protein
MGVSKSEYVNDYLMEPACMHEYDRMASLIAVLRQLIVIELIFFLDIK